jgi:hypothetical protein
VTGTGFDMNACFNPDSSFVASVDGEEGSGATLVLKLAESSSSLDRWTFNTIADDVPAGVSFVGPDRLWFTNAADASTAKSLLGL